jgi:hypothetical protein
MFPLIYMLVLLFNDWSICIYYGTKEFASISSILHLTVTQKQCMQIFTKYHPFLRDAIGNNIIQCTEHIILDEYGKAQKILPQNSKY